MTLLIMLQGLISAALGYFIAEWVGGSISGSMAVASFLQFATCFAWIKVGQKKRAKVSTLTLTRLTQKQAKPLFLRNSANLVPKNNTRTKKCVKSVLPVCVWVGAR